MEKDHNHAMNKNDVTKIRDEIITVALPNVTFDGWNWELIIKAAEEAGHKDTVVRLVFPDQMRDVLDAFADLADREMQKNLSDINPEDLPVRERVATALMTRYGFLQSHKEPLRQSLQFWIIPTRKTRAAKIVWRTADRIWNWAGDTSKDYNRYTKRTLLSGIIVSSTLYWLNNSDETLDSLRAFIDRRIENVLKCGKIINKIKKTS